MGVMRTPKTKEVAEHCDKPPAQPLTVPRANCTASHRDSDFFRLPRPGTRCPLSGLSRTSILEHGEDGEFKLIRVRKRGAQRGIVLVETKSFLWWLHSLPALNKETK